MVKDKESITTKLERGRAEFAYKKVFEVKDKKFAGEYRSHVKKLAQMILSNGLGQSLAFVFSKKRKDDAYNALYSHIAEYLESEIPARESKEEKGKELVEWVIGLDSLKYRYVTEEVIAFLNWLRRFAEGMIEEKGEDKE